MSKLVGWVILVAAGALIYSLAFTTYETWTGSWRTTDSGGLVRVNVECPTPFQVLAFDAQSKRGEDESLCEPSARTLAVEAGVVAIAAIMLTWASVTRPKPAELEPLSSLLNLAADPSRDRVREETPAGSERAGRHR